MAMAHQLSVDSLVCGLLRRVFRSKEGQNAEKGPPASSAGCDCVVKNRTIGRVVGVWIHPDLQDWLKQL